jgi:hypothetical protein
MPCKSSSLKYYLEYFELLIRLTIEVKSSISFTTCYRSVMFLSGKC